jgi:hypothetical protein
MLSIHGAGRRVCSGLTRRTLLQAGGAGLFGLSLPKLLAAEQAQPFTSGRAKSVIFLFLFGGPSQLETFDLKPQAPETIRGPFKPIHARTPELQICEHLPRLAAASDRYCVVRSLTHSYNDHSGGAHYIQTGRRWHVPIGGGFNATPEDWPSIGSVVECLAERSPDRRGRELPSYVVVPNALGRIQTYSSRLIRPGQYAGWLGRGYDPISTAIDKRDPNDNPYYRPCTDEELDFQIDGLAAGAELTLDRLNRRRSLLNQFDQGLRELDSAATESYDRFQERALGLVTSDDTRKALDLRRERAATRDRYGRHLFGQATLMARRLIQAGVRFVTVHWDCPDGYGWDSHVHSNDARDHLLPGLDQAVSALLVDLDDHGLLDETLVVCLGEMGRTPRANANWGRDHWSTLFPALLAGAGIRGGTLYGASDKDGAWPIERPTPPEDLAATIYHALGIDPELRLLDRQARPVPVCEGTPLIELFT